MVNKSGKNGRNNGEVPSDDTLKRHLNDYARLNLTIEQRLQRLESDLGYSIKRTCLAKLQRRLQIPSTRRRLPKEMVRDLVEDKIVALQDSSKGAETIRKSLAEEGIKIPRSDVRNCAREVDPLGHARRKRVRRAPYTPSNSATPPPAN